MHDIKSDEKLVWSGLFVQYFLSFTFSFPCRIPTNTCGKPTSTTNLPWRTRTSTTTSVKKSHVMRETHEAPTTCSSPTDACRRSLTTWTVTPASWLRSATRVKQDHTCLKRSAPLGTPITVTMSLRSPKNPTSLWEPSIAPVSPRSLRRLSITSRRLIQFTRTTNPPTHHVLQASLTCRNRS